MADADAVGNVNDADSETTIWVFVKRRGGSIERATFRAFGCSACIAAGSVATELITGQPLGEAARLSGEAIERALGGLPAPKRYCAELAARAVQRAVGVLGVRAI